MRVLSDALKTSNYGSEPMLQNCEISISIGFTQVDGRVLPSPKVFNISFCHCTLETCLLDVVPMRTSRTASGRGGARFGSSWSLKGKEEVCSRTADNIPQILLSSSSSRRHGAPSMAMQGTPTTCPTRTLLELRLCERWFRDTLKEAKAGDINMQVLVGQMYYSGYDVPRDDQKVCSFFYFDYGSCTEGVCGFDEMVAGKERKYYMLSGKGGVGKTSCAVSLVVRFANHGHPTMIVSTDPAHSLSDYFAQEVERETAKTADMKEKGANPYDLKQQENVLAESRMMIPDCHKRLEAALVDLKGALAELEKSNEKEGDTEFAKDAAFGYKSSNLRDGSACAVNAASKRDMAVFALGMIKEELMGKHFLSRTTASFVSSYRPTRSRT
ncbi:hypothetical protein Ahy_B08g089720 isoform F [Arachis hypogaea]|nr:hypothetical protein Ahy_B08g089720 isoform F [Arachis hypogaea]